MTDPAAVAPAELVDRLRALVLAVPGVLRLYDGRFGEVATYLPGRKVVGIRSHDDGTDVHIVVEETEDLRSVALAVHRVVEANTGGPVHVYIDDIAPTPSLEEN